MEKETPGISDLNPSEREVYELLVGGFEDSEIARSLRISQEEVKAISASAGDKLGLSNFNDVDKRTQAVEHFINRFTEVMYEAE